MNPHSFALMRLLADGEFHSGEALAKALSVSRGTVWNAVKELEAAGIGFSRVKGRGYRLQVPYEALDGEKIAALLGEKSRHFDIGVVDETASTNDALLAGNFPSGKVLAAELQTAGRGRMGRKWHGGLGESLAFSVNWIFPQGAGKLSGLGLAIGVAVARALAKLGAEEIALKWPNDVMHRYRKLAGILIEATGDMLGPTTAVIGIGVNFRLSAAVKDGIDQAATDIHEISPHPPGRNALLAAILAEIPALLQEFEKNGLENIGPEWNALHAYRGKTVKLRLADGGFATGITRGIGSQGELLLETEKGVSAHFSGEVALSRPQ